MNIREKGRNRAVFLHCAGPRVQDIFDILEDTGDDFETAAKKLMEYFEPRKHHLFKMYESRKLRVSGVNGHWGNSNLMSWTSVLFNSYWLTRSH